MTDNEKELRKCSRCNSTILESFFSINRKGELYKTCDKCRERRKITRTKHYNENKEVIQAKQREHRLKNLDKYREYSRNNHKNNGDQWQDNSKKYYQENRESILEKKKIYQQENREVINKARRTRYKTNLKFRITSLLRSRFKKVVNGTNKTSSVLELVGCTIEELKEHLERRFVDGMSWDNKNEWHIDHIRPCCSFNMEDIEQQKLCFHYSNLQPLWAIDNIVKGGSYEA